MKKEYSKEFKQLIVEEHFAGSIQLTKATFKMAYELVRLPNYTSIVIKAEIIYHEPMLII